MFGNFDGRPVVREVCRSVIVCPWSLSLADGMVLVGGTISTGCYGAEEALLVNTGTEVRAIGVRTPPERNVTCVRAVESTALLAVEPDVLAVEPDVLADARGEA